MFYAPILFVTLLFIVVATGIIMLVLVYQKKQLQYLNDKEQLKVNFEKEILESKLEIQEQTMKNISQEVHDNIGQILSVVKLNLNLMHCEEPLLKEKINDTNELVGKVIQDLRNLSKSLDRDTISERGLVKAIEYEFAILKKTGAYKTTLTIEGNAYVLPNQIELILFRIFQEVINNIIKHAQATLVKVSISFQPHKFSLCIHDNGRGFDTINLKSNSGSGIKNMRSRSRLIGADYTIESERGKGTSIKIKLPVT